MIRFKAGNTGLGGGNQEIKGVKIVGELGKGGQSREVRQLLFHSHPLAQPPEWAKESVSLSHGSGWYGSKLCVTNWILFKTVTSSS